MLGLKRGTVTLLPHEAEWEERGRQLVALLREVLGDAARDIQHVGSTSIAYICAKPVLDIAVGMDDPERVLGFIPALKERGVIFRGRGADDEGGLLFVTGNFASDTRTGHIHVVVWQGTAWYNYIDFRDYLNAMPEQALRYERRKRELAAQFAYDREKYTAGKGPLIAQLLEQAARWRKGKEE